MQSIAPIFVVLGVCLVAGTSASAQEQPPRIGPFVIDLRGTFPMFPDALELAQSRGLLQAELPGVGIGAHLGVHVYPLKWHVITFGIGAEVMASQSRRTPAMMTGQPILLDPVTETFATIAPQLSFNFGTGHGWSYISGGIGQSTWSIVPDGQEPLRADSERLKTINYGGGARWFAKKHLAFSFDVRFYAINPSTPAGRFPSGPRTTLTVLGAGISVK